MLKNNPKTKAKFGVTNLAGIGRPRVRVIIASSSFSIHWLSTAAPAAENAVPKIKQRRIEKSFLKGSCTRYPSEAVKTERMLSRGLVNSYKPIIEMTELDDISLAGLAMISLVGFTSTSLD